MFTQTHKMVLRTLASVIEEATQEPTDWALIGSSSLQLQGINIESNTIEFMTTKNIASIISDILGAEIKESQNSPIKGSRLHLEREGISIYIFGDPQFEGEDENFQPVKIPSIWTGLNNGSLDGHQIPCSPPEWELILAIALNATNRINEIQQYLSEFGYDSRLVVRLLREGHASVATENIIWSLLEEQV